VVTTAAAVNDEDGIQWWWTMKMAFNGSGSIEQQRRWGLQIGIAKATMEIDWGGDDGCQRLTVAMDKSGRWCLTVVMAMDGSCGRGG
jgi:hypothetical protein